MCEKMEMNDLVDIGGFESVQGSDGVVEDGDSFS